MGTTKQNLKRVIVGTVMVSTLGMAGAAYADHAGQVAYEKEYAGRAEAACDQFEDSLRQVAFLQSGLEYDPDTRLPANPGAAVMDASLLSTDIFGVGMYPELSPLNEALQAYSRKVIDDIMYGDDVAVPVSLAAAVRDECLPYGYS